MIKDLLERLLYNPYRAVKRSPYVSMGASKLSKTFKIRFCVPRAQAALEIGDECILMHESIFESDQGFISIGNRVFINAGTRLICRERIIIGNDVTIAWACTIYDHNSHSLDYRDRINDQRQQLLDWETGSFVKNKNWSTVKSKPIRIHDYVWIGFGVVVLKGVTIGEGAVIGAGSVVATDIPAWSIAVGNPARVVKKLPKELIRE